MKIFCVGRNYAAHAQELNNDLPDNPLIFMKPSTAILHKDRDFYIPDFSNNIHYEAELVLKIAKNGKSIEPKFASKYISAITVGLDFTARDLQDQLKKNGHPWEIAKAFDGSAVIGEWQDVRHYQPADTSFSLDINGVKVQQGNTTMMLFSFDKIISYISRFFTLQTGDLIFTGTPAGVGAIKCGDVLEGFLENEKVLECKIK